MRKEHAILLLIIFLIAGAVLIFWANQSKSIARLKAVTNLWVPENVSDFVLINVGIFDPLQKSPYLYGVFTIEEKDISEFVARNQLQATQKKGNALVSFRSIVSSLAQKYQNLEYGPAVFEKRFLESSKILGGDVILDGATGRVWVSVTFHE